MRMYKDAFYSTNDYCETSYDELSRAIAQQLNNVCDIITKKKIQM